MVLFVRQLLCVLLLLLWLPGSRAGEDSSCERYEKPGTTNVKEKEKVCLILVSNLPQLGLLRVGEVIITAELANTPETRQRGLMYRTSLPPQHGMLFVFNREGKYCMWMRNTPLPLSVAFINRAKRIVNIEAMQPLSDETHCAKQQVLYALEMPQGWFAKHDLAPGTIIFGLPKEK